MSEPFLDRLIQFTPDAGGLNRDALLFAAGRGSVRPNRGWKALASVLASTQALSLLLLWPASNPAPEPLSAAMPRVPGSYRALDPSTPHPNASARLWSARRGLLESQVEDRAAVDTDFIESEPPLRAFAPSLLN